VAGEARGGRRLAGRRLHVVHDGEVVGRLDRLGAAHGACLLDVAAAVRVGRLPIVVLQVHPL